MANEPRIPLGAQAQDIIRRDRLAKLCVMVADRDFRTASLVQRILFSFGFRNLDITTNGESALALLRARPYDIIITEWNMTPVDGVTLIRAIRSAKDDKRIPRDIPILMLTGRTDTESVAAARDAGVTEFVAKPFSAKTISNRIIQIIDNPRAFVESEDYIGPDRRRRGVPPEGVAERRGVRKGKQGTVKPANHWLHQQLGNATDIINDLAISQAQADLLKAESDYIVWAHADIMHLQQAYEKLEKRPDDVTALGELSDAAYTIHSQAGIFGYQLGSEVAHLLIEYLRNHRGFNADNLIVINKHIEAITTIFRQKIKDNGQDIAKDIVTSLRKLVQKLG
jgi:two-component system chemotaxis response regulator CheY